MAFLQTVVFILLPVFGSLYEDDGNQCMITNLQSQLKIVSDSLSTLTCGKVIAFHATLSHDVQDLAENSPLVFNTVKVNKGGGYDSKNGMFTAPVGGVYVCDWSILTKKNVYFHSELVVNGEQKAVNNLHASSLKHRQATTMTIINLDKGDQVWIKPLKGYRGTFAYGGGYTKISCFKL